MRLLFRFVRLIKQFFTLYKDYGYEPKDYIFMMEQYIKVICNLTNGRMSKPMYYAKDILSEINDCYCDGCEKNADT